MRTPHSSLLTAQAPRGNPAPLACLFHRPAPASPFGGDQTDPLLAGSAA